MKVTGCLPVYLSVYVYGNCYAAMVILYSVSSHRSWEGFGGRVPPLSEEISILEKITYFSFQNLIETLKQNDRLPLRLPPIVPRGL